MGGGYRTTRIAEELPDYFICAGWSHPQNAAPNAPIAGGFALTCGCPKELWDLWLEQNKTSAMVKNGLIFANSKNDYVEDKASERDSVKCGLERLDPDKLPSKIEKFQAA